jgi:hypothetical protein
MSRNKSSSRSTCNINESPEKESSEYISNSDYLKLNTKNVSKDVQINRKAAKKFFVEVGSNSKSKFCLTGPLPKSYKKPVKKIFKTPSGFLSFDKSNPNGPAGQWKLSKDDYQKETVKFDLDGAVKLGILTLPDYQMHAFERDPAGIIKGNFFYFEYIYLINYFYKKKFFYFILVKIDKERQHLGGLSGDTATKKIFQEYRRGIYD